MIKYNFSQNTTEAAVDDIINKLTQHLVPKYFSRIEKATSDDGLIYIQGYDNNDIPIFRMRNYCASSDIGRSVTTGISLYDKSNSAWQTVLNLAYDNYNNRYFLASAYVFNGGIFFIGTYEYMNITTLCLDNQNNAACLSTPRTYSNSSYGVSTYSQSGYLSYTVAKNDRDNISGSYYLVPFLTKDGTLKRVWHPLIKQYNAESECMRIMQLDGKDYFVMPGFLIEDF